MVKMQAVDITTVMATFGNGLHFDTQPSLFPTLYKWLQHVPDAYADSQQQARLSLHCWHSAVLALVTGPKCT